MIEDIKFLNRDSGCIESEKVYGENWLSLIYGTPLGKIPLWVAIKRAWFSKWYGHRMDNPTSKNKIFPFIKKFGLNEDEFLKKPSEYKTFNEFFSRQLTNNARPIDPNEGSVIFPADGRHTGIQNLSKIESIFVKGQQFDLPALFESDELARPYREGSMVISRLCPVDYHRFHFPVTGISSIPQLINGSLYSVNPIALRQNIGIFWQNKRYLSFIESSNGGKVASFLVGATCVGSVKITSTLPANITKGEEYGYFLFGGSSVLTLFEKDAVSLADDLIESTTSGIELYAKMGQSLGIIN
ncbi:MAG: phosphatidylserine decarboxylase [Opitutae bacterium]|jgi:phosphatidylserine decarboxylase|nr:phosphatidylserine decarboxylase [Opitutae bacterium]MBT7404508.1 phosphatidylserine decarboxylase [Opitutae bacterium]